MTNKITESEVIDFEELLMSGKMSYYTVYNYMSVIRRFAQECNDKTDLNEYNRYIHDHCILKKTTYARVALKKFVDFLKIPTNTKKTIRRNLLPVNNSEPDTRRLVSDRQKYQIINLLSDYKHKIIALIQSVTGVRTSSILKLKRGTIAWEEANNKVSIRIDFVGKRDKKFPMWIYNSKICDMIDMYTTMNLIDEKYYFLKRGTKRNQLDLSLAIRSNYKAYERDLHQAMVKCGYKKGDFKTHDFRRLFARSVWNLTHDPVSVKEALHHARFDTTARYLRQTGLQNKDVLEKLDEQQIYLNTT